SISRRSPLRRISLWAYGGHQRNHLDILDPLSTIAPARCVMCCGRFHLTTPRPLSLRERSDRRRRYRIFNLAGDYRVVGMSMHDLNAALSNVIATVAENVDGGLPRRKRKVRPRRDVKKGNLS